MKFQEGDWVLWNGHVGRVNVLWPGYVAFTLECGSKHIATVSELASHQVPWELRYSGHWMYEWEPLCTSP